jgi:hypothetical protein
MMTMRSKQLNSLEDTIMNKSIEQVNREAADTLLNKWNGYDVDTGGSHMDFKADIDETSTDIIELMVNSIRQFSIQLSTLHYLRGELEVRRLRGQTIGVMRHSWSANQ